MNNILNKKPVKREEEFINKFDPRLKIFLLDTTARTAKEASSSLRCETGSIVKTLLIKVDKHTSTYNIEEDSRTMSLQNDISNNSLPITEDIKPPRRVSEWFYRLAR